MMKPVMKTLLLTAAISLVSVAGAQAEGMQQGQVGMQQGQVGMQQQQRTQAGIQQQDHEAARERQAGTQPGQYGVQPGQVGMQDQAGRLSQMQPAAGSQIMQLNRNETRNVQAALRQRGYYTAAIDGIWGPRTTAAMREFERDHGLSVTGRGNVQALQQLGFNIGQQPGQQFGQQQWQQQQQQQQRADARGLGGIEPAAGVQIVQLQPNHVRDVQASLRDRGYYRAGVDGIWGPRTTEAMRQFERDHGLPVTGRGNVQALQQLGFNIGGQMGEDAQGNRPMGMQREVRPDPTGQQRTIRQETLQREQMDIDRRGLPDTPIEQRSGVSPYND